MCPRPRIGHVQQHDLRRPGGHQCRTREISSTTATKENPRRLAPRGRRVDDERLVEGAQLVQHLAQPRPRPLHVHAPHLQRRGGRVHVDLRPPDALQQLRAQPQQVGPQGTGGTSIPCCMPRTGPWPGTALQWPRRRTETRAWRAPPGTVGQTLPHMATRTSSRSRTPQTRGRGCAW